MYITGKKINDKTISVILFQVKPNNYQKAQTNYKNSSKRI